MAQHGCWAIYCSAVNPPRRLNEYKKKTREIPFFQIFRKFFVSHKLISSNLKNELPNTKICIDINFMPNKVDGTTPIPR